MFKSSSFIFTAITLLVFLFACSSDDESRTENPGATLVKERNPQAGDLVSRGSYLTTVGGCNDCHTPKLFDANGMHLDSSRMFAGHIAGTKLPPINKESLKAGSWYSMSPDLTAFTGPWGISYAANLTPDSTTGIGGISEASFISALRTGKHFGLSAGRPILPPMPWYNLARLEEDDLRAIYSYLRSIPPINNRVPGPLPPTEVK